MLAILRNLITSKSTQTVAGGAAAGTAIAQWLVTQGTTYLTWLPWDDAAFTGAATVFVAGALTAVFTRLVAWLRGKLDSAK